MSRLRARCYVPSSSRANGRSSRPRLHLRPRLRLRRQRQQLREAVQRRQRPCSGLHPRMCPCLPLLPCRHRSRHRRRPRLTPRTAPSSCLRCSRACRASRRCPRLATASPLCRGRHRCQRSRRRRHHHRLPRTRRRSNTQTHTAAAAMRARRRTTRRTLLPRRVTRTTRCSAGLQLPTPLDQAWTVVTAAMAAQEGSGGDTCPPPCSNAPTPATPRLTTARTLPPRRPCPRAHRQRALRTSSRRC